MISPARNAIDRQVLYPEIHYRHVQAALKSLVQKHPTDDPNPLHYLQLIENRLLKPGKPASPQKRVFEFRIFLTTLITERFTESRRRNNREPLCPNETRTSAMESIFNDILSENTELIGWSWLYYHYVRVDLNITRDEFRHSELFHHRTYTRYRFLAEMKLTEIIYEQEVQARQERKNALLVAKLPFRSSPLFGREDVLQHLERLLETHSSLCIQVFGTPGSGKTAVVGELLKYQLDRIEHLIWLHHPTSVDQIQEVLCAELGLRFEAIADYALSNSIALVLDDADALYADTEKLETFLNGLQRMTTFLVSQHRWLSEAVNAYVALEGLDHVAAQDYLNYLQKLQFHVFDQPLDPGEIDSLWRQSDGNPRQLKQALYDLLKPDER